MKLFQTLLIPLGAIGYALHAPDAGATPMPLDGSTWTVLDQAAPRAPYFFTGGPWTWESSEPVRLTVTDLYTVGDRFNVYDNGNLLGVTSVAGTNAGLIFEDTPERALLERAYSQGIWNLGPGAHSITIQDIRPPDSYASVAFIARRSAIASVPEGGSSIVMFGLALTGIAAYRSAVPRGKKARRFGFLRADS